MARHLNLGIRGTTIAVALACVFLGRPVHTVIAAETPAPPATTAAPAPSPEPAAKAPGSQTAKPDTPKSDTAKSDTPKPDACDALASIDSGDLTGVKPFAAQKDHAFGAALTDYVSCLAAAKGSSATGYCQLLPKADRDACLLRAQTVEKLKTPTKDKTAAVTMAPLLDQECRRQTTKATCDQLQQALTTKDVRKCDGIPHLDKPCRALVTGDPTPCGDDARCRELIENLTTLQQTGLGGLKGRPEPSMLDSLLAAANEGKSACAPLREALRPTCGSVAK